MGANYGTCDFRKGYPTLQSITQHRTRGYPPNTHTEKACFRTKPEPMKRERERERERDDKLVVSEWRAERSGVVI